MYLLITLCTIFAQVSAEAPALDALNDVFEGQPANEMMQRYLTEEILTALESRKARYEELKTPEEVYAYQKELKAFFVDQLGGFPERVPLNAQTLDSGETEWFRYEKIIFESRPNFFVTGLLYLPKDIGPWPGVIVPCGHSIEGKASDPYQRISMLLAASGMAALCYDPVGQGERYTYLKEDGSNEFGSTLEHTLIGVGAILTGTNTAGYRVWDGMRAIDYLQSRSDIIADRIGCTGNSGGGTLTSYLMALDERIVCAAPSCYLTTFEKLVTTIGPQDAEQNIFGQIAGGLDHADYVHLRAPKPTLICAATQDFFDINGTWQTFREAKRIYSRLGFSERVDLIENDDTHGFARPQREAAARWMSRWLLGIDRVITEPDFTVFTKDEALCTPEGQVLLRDNARSVLDLNLERAEQLEEKCSTFRKGKDDGAYRDKIRELIGLSEKKESAAKIIHPEDKSANSATKEFFVIQSEPGIFLRSCLVKPEEFTGGYVIICEDTNLETTLANDKLLDGLLSAGHTLCVVELRGFGETAGGSSGDNWRKYVGAEWKDYFLAYLLGKSYVGMRAADIMAITEVLRNLEERSFYLYASGQATVPALHAAALHPGLFVHTTLRHGIASWMDVVREPRAGQQLINSVHNALSWYDLPDLANLIPQEQLSILDPQTPRF
ncbi:MAG: alpha/beta hydrolase family protein [Candidatus Hydrogenedentales bacterium]